MKPENSTDNSFQKSHDSWPRSLLPPGFAGSILHYPTLSNRRGITARVCNNGGITQRKLSPRTKRATQCSPSKPSSRLPAASSAALRGFVSFGGGSKPVLPSARKSAQHCRQRTRRSTAEEVGREDKRGNAGDETSVLGFDVGEPEFTWPREISGTKASETRFVEFDPRSPVVLGKSG